VIPSLSLAQSDSGQGSNRSVPKKEREMYGVDFRVVNLLYQTVAYLSGTYLADLEIRVQYLELVTLKLVSWAR